MARLAVGQVLVILLVVLIRRQEIFRLRNATLADLGNLNLMLTLIQLPTIVASAAMETTVVSKAVIM
jgi:hypothetical protein